MKNRYKQIICTGYVLRNKLNFTKWLNERLIFGKIEGEK